MQLTMNKSILRLFKINIINSIFIFTICIFRGDSLINFIARVILIILYFIYLSRKKEDIIVNYQISFMILAATIVDATYNSSLISAPFWIKNITDWISLILLFKIILNKKVTKKMASDNFIKLIVLILIFSFLLYIIYNNSLINYLDVMRRMFRFIPVYIYFAYYEMKDLKETFKFYFIINIILFIIQSVLNVNIDFRNGMFGRISGAAFYYMLVIYAMIIIVKYFNNKGSILEIVFSLAFLVASLVLQDSKFYLFLFIIYLTIIFLIYKNDIIKKIMFVFIISCLLILSINSIKIISPKFAVFFQNKNLVNVAIEYMNTNTNDSFKMNRFEAKEFVFNNVNTEYYLKILGKGIGTASGPENNFYNIKETKYSVPKTNIYISYGELGYALSSTNIIKIESGYLGLVIFILIIVIFLRKSIKCIRSKMISAQIVGLSFGCILVSGIYSFYYTAQLFTRETNYILCIIIGLLRFYELKQLKSNEV